MSGEELEAMAGRATTEDATVQAEADEATEPVEPETPPPAAVDLEQLKQLTGILGFMIKGVGNIICDRAGVTLLGDDEVSPIAGAAIQVLCLYDLKLNPRLAAWCTLAVCAAPPILLRVDERREAKKAQEASHEPPDEPTTPPPATAYGEGENVTPAATRPKSKSRGRTKKT